MDVKLRQNKHWQAFKGAFDQQDFFDCHDHLEKIWLEAEGNHKLYLQALIQLSVALFHWQNHNLRGAISLIKKAQKKINYLSDQGYLVALFQQNCACCLQGLPKNPYKKEATLNEQLPLFNLDFLNEELNQRPS